MNAGGVPGGLAEGGGTTVLQAMLRDYLVDNEAVLFMEGCALSESFPISGLPDPLTVEALLGLTCEKDVDLCATHLACMASAFEDMPALSSTSDQVADKVRQALLRLMMALSECYVRAVEAERQYVALRHEPVWTQDGLLSSVLAAARLGFGLSFKAGLRDPLNVVDARPAAADFGNPDEAGCGLVHAEALAALQRLSSAETTQPPAAVRPIGNAYFNARRGLLQAKVRKMLGADAVLRVEAANEYEKDDKRKALQDYLASFALPTFFRAGCDVAIPDWAERVLGELSEAFNAAFAATNNREKESKEVGKQDKDGAEGRATHLHFHAPVANVSTGANANQAGGDINSPGTGE